MIKKSRNPVSFQTFMPNGTSWDFLTPSVYRYEDSKWINEFFNTGLIRLSSFKKFSSYTDELIGDRNEGKGITHLTTIDNKNASIVNTIGKNAYVLCSSILPKITLRKEFKRNSAFEIFDVARFSYELSKKIPGFIEGIQGNCIYKKDTSLFLDSSFNIGKYFDENPNLTTEMFEEIMRSHSQVDRLFIKKIKYAQQQEYRILFFTDNLETDYVDIHCPEAIQYCRVLDEDDYMEAN